MEDVVDNILFDIGIDIDGCVYIRRVKGVKSVDAIEYLAGATIRQIDVMFWIRIRCVWRIHHLWMESLFSTNIWSKSHRRKLPADYWCADVVDYFILYSAISVWVVDEYCCIVYSAYCA